MSKNKARYKGSSIKGERNLKGYKVIDVFQKEKKQGVDMKI